ncbi:HipA family kinase [Agaribacterium haliotis]|uniref:HipA family kinase n=1 Tax=Agaribacterium haliotis TaxID=2013869 RepID=UPI001177C849|nr:HipA family kinase [Agaribacterium haliotis]
MPNPVMLEVTEVTGRAKQGVTEPYICRCSDGYEYFVKGKDAGRSSQIYEWVAGCLGRALGLPIPHFEIVHVDEAFLDIPEFRGIGAGPAFASRKRLLNELTISLLSKVPVHTQQKLLLFDHWVQNGDRTLSLNGGNPNLFWEPGEQQLVVIDHNQAFDVGYCVQDTFNYHVFRAQADSVFSDLAQRCELSDQLASCLLNLDDILAQIPEDWRFLDEDRQQESVHLSDAQIRTILNRYENEQFWTER